MKKVYEDIQEFLDDSHNKLSIKEIAIQMGIVNRQDFNGDFLNCIFHDSDKTPSLQLKDEFFKCYACGVKGDIISFIELYYNIDFIESIKKITDFLNINIKNIKTSFDNKYNKLKNEWGNYLEQMSKASDYIKSFKKDFFPQDIGFDSKINYIVLPITSKSGNILGFTKRRIDFFHEDLKDKDGKFIFPKWKHSSLKDSLIGQCNNIFNYHLANKEFRKTQEIILVEGPKDVIAYQRIGRNNTICSCGTQNSSNVWKLALPIENIVLSMDSDKSGIHAVIKNVLYLSPFFNIQNIKIVVLPYGEDPYSTNNLKNFYENRISAISFFIKNSDKNEIIDLYKAVPEYNKIYILKEICLQKGFSISETESWLYSDKNESKEKSEKEILLSIINCEDVDVPFISINKARRILKLKYGININ